MDILFDFFQGIFNLGAVVMLPVVIFLLGIFFRMKIGTAIKSGLLVGIGFQGLVLVINFLIATIEPVILYYKSMGAGYTTLDLSFAAVFAATWSVPFTVFAIPVIIIINLILIKFKIVRVMNVDIWNFMHALVPGAMAYALSGSVVVGFIVAIIISTLNLFLAQWVAPKWEEFFGLDGTTCSTFSYISFCYPIGLLINKIIDKIPGLNNIDIDMGTLERKLGFFGDPAFIGVIVGAFLGILTKQNISTIATISIGISGVMVLLPRMVSVMMEGISSIGNAANSYMKKKIGENANIYIGMDIALGLGDPCCITITAITIPFVILLAFIIPNMTYFPLGVLTGVCYLAPMIVLSSKGNIVRSLIVMLTCITLTVFFANMFAPEATKMMNVTSIGIDGMVTGADFGVNPGNVIVAFLSRLFN